MISDTRKSSFLQQKSEISLKSFCKSRVQKKRIRNLSWRDKKLIRIGVKLKGQRQRRTTVDMADQHP